MEQMFLKCWCIHQVISSGSMQAAGRRPGGGVLARANVLILKSLMVIPTAAKNN
jgi:hypothetical protein